MSIKTDTDQTAQTAPTDNPFAGHEPQYHAPQLRRFIARDLYDNPQLGAALWVVWCAANEADYPALENSPHAHTVMALVHTMPAPVGGIASESDLLAALRPMPAAEVREFHRMVGAAWLETPHV